MKLVGFTALFAELFILIFSPFQSRQWVNSDWEYVGWTSLVILVFVLVLSLSRTAMYYYSRKNEISYVGYAFWVLLEIGLMALVYTLYPLMFQTELVETYRLSFLPLYKEAVLATAFILLIPYTWLILWFELKEKDAQIKLLTAGVQDNVAEEQPDMYNFYDEKGDLKLSVKPEMVYYLEAADNYVQIHYMASNKMQNLMIRNTLKNIEWRFRGKDLIRCHRSYIVNFGRVQMMRRVDGDVVLDFGDERVPNIPVSKGYGDVVMERFTKNQQ